MLRGEGVGPIAIVTPQDALSAIKSYVRSVQDTRSTGQATEHSYRPALQSLVEHLGGTGVRALNEPAHVACGAPDFIVEQGGVPIGHIECKDIGVNLDQIEKDEQIRRYRDGLPNLVLTDYLEFRWYVEGNLRDSARVGRLGANGKVSLESASAEQIVALLGAFFGVAAPTVGNSRELARRMAGKARLLRDGVNRVFQQENAGALNDLLTAYRRVLIADLTQADFADMQAQTAAYGLFAARCVHSPEAGSFTRQSAVFTETTPFLREVFGRIAGPGIDSRLAWIVDDLARLLNKADMAAVLKDFGSRAVREDPVVHFYEDFLAAYDPKLREMRGVYYTPEPVVSYIVRSVDRLLRDRFDLVDGLADTEQITLNARDGDPETVPRVLILDPAVGTGTFLREVITTIHGAVEGKGLGGAWPDYVREHLLPRLFGFEFQMAPYAICHLKLSLEIAGAESGFVMPDGQRLNVFLTNTLEEPHESSDQPALFAHEIARESASADDVKRDKPVMVVLGNPPYSGHSANKGEWISGLLHGSDGVEATGSYFHVDGALVRERQMKWLHNDYVKFIRYAQRRIERTGEGVLAFVTDNSYLDSPTFRGMRKSLMDTFDEIYLLDLHGNSKKRERTPEGGVDENVFDITQGVAIGLFVKRRTAEGGPASVFHADLWGERRDSESNGKYEWLTANDVETTQWAQLAPKSPMYLFIPHNDALAGEYESGWSVADVFPVNSVGIVTARDRLTIQYTSDEIRRVVEDFSSRDVESARLTYGLGDDVRDWKVSNALQDIHDHPIIEKQITSITYRPFDMRFTWYSGRSRGFIGQPGQRVMRHMIAGPNVGLATTRGTEIVGGWEHALAAKSVIQHHAVSIKEVNYLFPLYTYPTEAQEELGLTREPNLDKALTEAISAAIGLAYASDGSGDLQSEFGPEDVFHYIYGVLHSPEYRRRYADFLKADFPRVPVTGDCMLFAALANLGERLKSLHLMEVEADDAPAYLVQGNNRVDKPRYAPPTGNTPGRVFINKTQYFEGVAPETWEFTIGGYSPAQKWLKDRQRRVLSLDDIVHYRRVCAILAETPRLMARIDETIESHGGWPLR